MSAPGGAPPPPGPRTGPGKPEIASLAAVVLWLGGIGWLVLTGRLTAPRDALGMAAALFAVLLPVALICTLAALAQLSRTLRIERRALAAEIAEIRAQTALDGLEDRLLAVARVQSQLASDVQDLRGRTEAAAGTRLAPPGRPLDLGAAARPDVAPAMQEKPQLDLATAPDGDPPPAEDFIRALDFPDDEADEDGFRVLRAALRHRPTARLAGSAQDVLTRLAEDGIYMDDLTVRPADPVLWRAFAAGERGADVAGIGGILDRSSLALTAGRMRDDPGSRDAIHRFLRTFETVFADFAATASDSELIRFADTRTARAFMLCARAAGAFDGEAETG